MSDILSSITSSLHRKEFKKNDFEMAAAIFDVLGARDLDHIKTRLDRLHSLGGDLSKIGTLFLMANRKEAAHVLRDRFNVKIEDYRTTNSDMGLDDIEGYPLLASLAYKSSVKDYDALQRRALMWGANPDASWQVERRLPVYHNQKDPTEISWVSENIRALNHEFLEMLCAKSKEIPSPTEEARRIYALWDAIGTKDDRFYSDFRRVFELFGRGGEFGVSITPWDVPIGDSNLAIENAIMHARCNQYVDTGKARGQFEKWAEDTLKDRNEDCFQIVSRCVMLNDVFSTPPQWAIEGLTPSQAQDALKEAWKLVFNQWARDSSGGRSESVYQGASTAPCAEYKLSSDINPLKRLTEIAVSEPCLNGSESSEFLFGTIDDYNLSKLSIKGIDALAKLYPKFPNSPDASRSLSAIRELLVEQKELKGDKSSFTHPQIKIYHQSCMLRNKANEAAWDAKKKTGVPFQPSHPSPRL